MGTIRSLLKRVENLDIDSIIEKTFVRNEEKFAEKNRQQLFEGFDKDGERLKEYRSTLYAEVKHRMNPIPGEGNPDFKVTGAFYRGIEVRVDAPAIRTLLYDEKSEKLLERDPNIIGLGGKFKSDLITETLQPELVKDIRNDLKI
jgi:hypothetical protein